MAKTTNPTVKKSVVQKIKTKETLDGVILRERQAIVTFKINKGPEKVKKLSLGFTEFPKGVPTSTVSLRAGMTRGIVDFNYIRVDVEVSDTTLANPEARRICAENISDEILDIAVALTKKSAERLFGTKV